MMIVFVLNILDTKIKVSSGVNQQTMAIDTKWTIYLSVQYSFLPSSCLYYA